jgi:phosphate transport system substrate-binding protein
MKKIRYGLAACFFAFSLTTTSVAETLTIPGSGSPEYLLGELAKAFNQQQQKHQIIIPSSIGTAGGIREVAENTASLARVGRPLKGTELHLGLTRQSIGRDPVVVVGGAGVSARTLTRDQFVKVYSGQLTNWRDLGGKPGLIRAIGREQTDVSAQVLGREITEFASQKTGDNVKVVNLDPQMIALLDRFPTSLGFLNRSALAAAKTKLVVLQLDTIEPSAENVASARYPFWLEMGLIYKEASLTEAGRAFLAFVNSPVGVRVLRANGILPATSSH